MCVVEYSDFRRMELKVGIIKNVARIPKTDKLYKLGVDIGGEKIIPIVTSLVPYYKEDKLFSKRVIVLLNLKPVEFCGVLSQGMILCAEKDDESECVFLTTEREIEVGTKIT